MWPFNLFKPKHSCKFDKPIISRYISFNTRDIIYECTCGKRVIKRDTRAFSDPFPIPTNPLLSQRDFEKMAEDIDHLKR
jgi:hypothetical protein